MARLKVGVPISGRGSNMAALAEACRDEGFPAEIVLVLSNEPGAEGLDRARDFGIETAVVDHRDFAGRAAFDAAVTARLEAAGVELVCLAGFMRLFTADFVEHWRDRLLNIHPSLLPAFRGLNTHERALAAGVRLHGCTVHFVRPELDDGPIVMQAAVPVQPDDTAASLAARVLEQEHRIYPAALRLVAGGAVTVEGERVVFADSRRNDGLLLNPPLP